MAKKSLRYREVKRERLAKRYASKRAAIFAVLEDSNATPEEKFAARLEFQKIPRNATVSYTHLTLPTSDLV